MEELLSEESYQNANKKVKLIGIIIMILGLLLAIKNAFIDSDQSAFLTFFDMAFPSPCVSITIRISIVTVVHSTSV